MLIYLMRHGETDWNKAGRLQGQSDIALNEFGIELAVKTAEGLRNIDFQAAFSFPLEGKCDNVLIVAHGALNRCILNLLAGIPDKDFWRIDLPNCAVSILSLEHGILKILEESKVYYGTPVNGRP